MQSKDCVNEESQRHKKKVNRATRERGAEWNQVERAVEMAVEMAVEIRVAATAAAAETIEAAASN